MVIVGWIFAGVGAILFLLSIALVIRSNPDKRVPYFANTDPVASHSIWTRVLGVFFLVPSGVLIGVDRVGFILGFYGVVLLLGIGMIWSHNKRISANVGGLEATK